MLICNQGLRNILCKLWLFNIYKKLVIVRPLILFVVALMLAIFLASHPVYDIKYVQMFSGMIKVFLWNAEICLSLKPTINEVLLLASYYIVGLELKNIFLQRQEKQQNSIKFIVCTYVSLIIFYWFLFKFCFKNAQYFKIMFATDSVLILELMRHTKKYISGLLIDLIKIVICIDEVVAVAFIAFYNFNSSNSLYMLMGFALLVLIFSANKILEKNFLLFSFLSVILIWCLYKLHLHSSSIGLCCAFTTPIIKNNKIMNVNISTHKVNNSILETLVMINRLFLVPMYLFFNLGVKISLPGISYILNSYCVWLLIVMVVVKPLVFFVAGLVYGNKKLLLKPTDFIIIGLFCSIGLTTAMIVSSTIIIDPEQLLNVKIVILLSSGVSCLFILACILFYKILQKKSGSCNVNYESCLF